MAKRRISKPLFIERTWQATFRGEEGRPTTIAEVDGQQYVRGKPVVVDRATRERLEGLSHLQFEFQEVRT